MRVEGLRLDPLEAWGLSGKAGQDEALAYQQAPAGPPDPAHFCRPTR